MIFLNGRPFQENVYLAFFGLTTLSFRMPAHTKGALTQTHLAIPVSDGLMLPGNYQGVFLFEHRRVPRARALVLYLSGHCTR